MTFIIRGKSTCKMCGEIIKEEDEITLFSAFISDPEDPLYFFNDSGFHKACFDSHPLAEEALKRLQEMQFGDITLYERLRGKAFTEQMHTVLAEMHDPMEALRISIDGMVEYGLITNHLLENGSSGMTFEDILKDMDTHVASIVRSVNLLFHAINHPEEFE